MEGLNKTTKILRVAGVPPVIRTEVLPNKNLEYYRYANPFYVLLRKYVTLRSFVIWDHQ
jgi:hypothetical protein